MVVIGVLIEPGATPTTPINPPGTTAASDDPLRNSNTYLAQAATWTQVTVSSTVPAGATVFQLQLRAYNGATVSFDNISFKYAEETIISLFSLEVKKGKLIAIVGESLSRVLSQNSKLFGWICNYCLLIKLRPASY